MTDPSQQMPPQQFAPPQKQGMGTGKKVALFGCGGLLALLLLMGGCTALLAAGSSSSDDDKPSDSAAPTGQSTTAAPAATSIFPGRPDFKKGDKEREIGQAAEFSGYTANVTAAPFSQRLSSFETDGYIVADVTIVNRDDRAQPYNTYHWKLITPNGQIIDPTFTSTGGELGSGDLANGGTVSGKVPFEVGTTKGNYYLVYDPDFASTERGVWKIAL